MESHAPADAAERYRYARAMLLANLTSVLALTALAASLITARAELAIETVAALLKFGAEVAHAKVSADLVFHHVVMVLALLLVCGTARFAPFAPLMAGTFVIHVPFLFHNARLMVGGGRGARAPASTVFRAAHLFRRVRVRARAAPSSRERSACLSLSRQLPFRGGVPIRMASARRGRRAARAAACRGRAARDFCTGARRARLPLGAAPPALRRAWARNRRARAGGGSIAPRRLIVTRESSFLMPVGAFLAPPCRPPRAARQKHCGCTRAARLSEARSAS